MMVPRFWSAIRGFLPQRFNFELGAQIGTGLSLIKSLLPSQGATLAIVERGHLVVAILNLSMPSVLRSVAAGAWEERVT